MTIRIRTRAAVLSAIMLTATCLVIARQPAPLTQVIPNDPQVIVGKLPNGLRYYIRANPKPEKRAELRLVVNAGSILEDDDQRGLAHFVEHMAFNGTTHFPKMEIVKFLESLGMRFGADLNASTGFDETIYRLQVPADKPDVLDKSFLILEDWAHNVSFEQADIDKERGVITEEWRLGRGAEARMQDTQFPVLLQGSRYADRLPIGKMDVVQNFKRDRLTKFYADWYRPDLMAVIAVGDFDKAAVETLVRSHFGPIPAPAKPTVRPNYDVPDHPGTLYTVATDKEATGTGVTVYDLLPVHDPTTIGAYRSDILESLFSNMINARFAEMAQKPDAPFLGAGESRGQFVRTKEAATLGAGVVDGGVERGLEALFTEADRVARFGFTPTELARQKTSLLRSLEREVTEKANASSGGFADEYARNFTDREPMPGIDYEYALYQRFLPEITIDEVNAIAKTFAVDRNRIVAVTGPQKPGLVMPDQTKLAATITAASAKPLTPYVDAVATSELFDVTPTPGAVIKTTAKEAFGITEWELSNGARIVLKPTTFKEDEVIFRATGPGGTSLASDQDFITAKTAALVVSSGGLGKMSMQDLRKSLNGKVASVTPSIGDIDEGLSGGASRKDIETMFQLIYLTFTQPRADAQLFGVMTSQLTSMLANQKATPEFAFAEALQSTLTQNHLRARAMTPEMIGQMNLDKSMAFYRDRFADASDFTFTFIGSFTLDEIRPLVERYLGSLPALHRKETWKDVGIRPPTGVITKRVEKGIEPKSQAAIVFTGPFKYDQVQRIAIRAMSQVLETRLREVLREDLGGTYSVSVSPNYSKVPREDYSVSIEFGCGPDRTESLLKNVFEQIDLLKTKGPTDQQVADVRQALLRDVETNMKSNSYLLSQIAVRYEFGEDLTSLFALSDYYNKLTPAMIQDAASTYLNTKNYVQVALFPEKK
jgi:zinc protease